MTYQALKLLLRMATHQLRMGQALVLLLQPGTAGGMNSEEVAEKLGDQNYYLSCAIEDSK